jgi:hypothetical protein
MPIESVALLVATRFVQESVELGAPVSEPVRCSLLFGNAPFGSLADGAEIDDFDHAGSARRDVTSS